MHARVVVVVDTVVVVGIGAVVVETVAIVRRGVVVVETVVVVGIGVCCTRCIYIPRRSATTWEKTVTHSFRKSSPTKIVYLTGWAFELVAACRKNRSLNL